MGRGMVGMPGMVMPLPAPGIVTGPGMPIGGMLGIPATAT